MVSQPESAKKVSIMCFHDELCQVFNALMTALSLRRSGAEVTIFFGSRGVNALHKGKVDNLVCLPDQPEEEGEAVMKRMEEMELPTVRDLLEILHFEGAKILACPLNVPLFGMTSENFVLGVKIADPSTYYKDVVMQADMNLTF